MAKIEDVFANGTDTNWGGIEQLTPTSRIGYGDNLILIEKTLPDGSAGVYNLPHIPAEKVGPFLAWLAAQK